MHAGQPVVRHSKRVFFFLHISVTPPLPPSPCVFLLSAADVGVAQLVRRSGRPVDRRALGRPAASRVPLQPGHAAAVRGGVWR